MKPGSEIMVRTEKERVEREFFIHISSGYIENTSIKIPFRYCIELKNTANRTNF